MNLWLWNENLEKFKLFQSGKVFLHFACWTIHFLIIFQVKVSCNSLVQSWFITLKLQHFNSKVKLIFVTIMKEKVWLGYAICSHLFWNVWFWVKYLWDCTALQFSRSSQVKAYLQIAILVWEWDKAIFINLIFINMSLMFIINLSILRVD